MDNKKIGIVIPTYNRPEILKSTLFTLLKECVNYNIPIYIVDDSTNNDTKTIVEEIIKNSPLNTIFYIKNKINLGHDENFFKCISLCKEDYIWYLGDSTPLFEDSISKIIPLLNYNYDLICYNSHSRSNLNSESKEYDNIKDIIKDIAWHLTKTGVTIYKRESIPFDKINIELYKNFPQFATIFLIFYYKINSKLYWLNEKLVYGNGKKKSYWLHSIFETFIDDLKKTLVNLPLNLSTKQINFLIKEHSTKSNLFTYSNFLTLRLQGILDFRVFKYRKKDIAKYSNLNLKYIFLLSIIPIPAINILFSLKKIKISSLF